jgi:thiamine pyrophosphokinase
MLALIFASGTLTKTTELQNLVAQADIFLAADGGANHCHRLDITPDILVGDFDSINTATLTKYQKEGIEIHRHPVQKDAIDLEISLDLARYRGATTIWLVGVLGGRWDMSLANIMLTASDKYKDIRLSLLGPDCTMHIFHPGQSHSVSGFPGQTISLLPLKDDVHGITLTGFKYPLNDHTISFGASLGISNNLINDQGRISFTKGVLICVQLFDHP